MSFVNEKILSMLKAMFRWPSKKGTPPTTERVVVQGSPERLEHGTEDETFKEVVTGEALIIPDPEFILGPGSSKFVDWKHKDDLFVDFVVAETLVVDEPDFFLRYIDNKLTPEERETMPPSYHQCSADVADVVMTNLTFNMLEIKDDHYGFLVGVGETIGLLLLRVEDSIDIIRRSAGLVDDENRERYVLQFMRFHPDAIKRIGPCLYPSEWIGNDPDMQLIVNFAHFEDEEESTQAVA